MHFYCQPPLLVVFALLTASPVAAQTPAVERTRAFITKSGALAEPYFTNLRVPGFQPRAENIAMPILAVAPPELAWQRHWLEAGLAAASIDRASTRAEAIASYAAAVAAATGPNAERQRLAAQIALTALVWPTDPAAATAQLDAITTTRPEALAAIAQLRGRIALSARDTDTALAQFGAALAASVSSRDPASVPIIPELTADIAMAHALAGRTDLAAAHLASGTDYHENYVIAAEDLPACIPELGLTRETAVILRVARQGTATIAAEPVWSRGPLSIAALGHLRAAVASWPWDKDDVIATPVTRIFLSCVAGLGQFHSVESRINLAVSLPTLIRWLSSQNVDAAALIPIPDGGENPIEQLQADIARIEAAQGYDAPALVLLYLVLSDSQTDEERGLGLDRAIGIAERLHAPLDVQAALARIRWYGPLAKADRPAAYAALAATLAAFPASEVGSPSWLSTAISLLLVAPIAYTQAADNSEFAALAARILALPVTLLPAEDDLRRLVHAELADEALRWNDKPTAFRHLIDAGFIAERCYLADAPSPVRGNELSDDDFPVAIRKANISGFVHAQRRVNPDGTTASARMVVARPPLLFDAPTLAAMNRGTQPPPRRAGKPFACDANLAPVRWRLTN